LDHLQPNQIELLRGSRVHAAAVLENTPGAVDRGPQWRGPSTQRVGDRTERRQRAAGSLPAVSRGNQTDRNTVEIDPCVLCGLLNYYRTDGYKIVLGDGNFVKENDKLGASVTYYGPGKNYYIRAFGENLTNQKFFARSIDGLKAVYSQAKPVTYGVALGIDF
jgi:hypothetical protein